MFNFTRIIFFLSVAVFAVGTSASVANATTMGVEMAYDIVDTMPGAPCVECADETEMQSCNHICTTSATLFVASSDVFLDIFSPKIEKIDLQSLYGFFAAPPKQPPRLIS